MQGKGWIPVEDLQPGDLIAGNENQYTAIDSIAATGRTETVYNIRVSEDHTYFVGDANWGFSVWVHNAYKPKATGNGKWNVVDDAGNPATETLQQLDGTSTKVVKEFDTKEAAEAFAKELNANLARKLWSISRYDKVVRWKKGKIYHDPDTGLWWSKDIDGHGGSAWKVFEEEGKGLKWIADADKYGNYLRGKHKGPVGLFIPWKELN